MSNTRNQCDGVGHATKSAMSLDRDFAQLTQSYQAHGGEVNTGMTPQVQYSYADGSSNTIRITGMTYPNGRNVVDDYGTADSLNHFPFGGEQKGTLYLSIKLECPNAVRHCCCCARMIGSDSFGFDRQGTEHGEVDA